MCLAGFGGVDRRRPPTGRFGNQLAREKLAPPPPPPPPPPQHAVARGPVPPYPPNSAGSHTPATQGAPSPQQLGQHVDGFAPGGWRRGGRAAKVGAACSSGGRGAGGRLARGHGGSNYAPKDQGGGHGG